MYARENVAAIVDGAGIAFTGATLWLSSTATSLLLTGLLLLLFPGGRGAGQGAGQQLRWQRCLAFGATPAIIRLRTTASTTATTAAAAAAAAVAVAAVTATVTATATAATAATAAAVSTRAALSFPWFTF